METLLTSHKGVDLHAATARRVMQDRLTGGERLADLRRCAFHVFGGPLAVNDKTGPTLAQLLATGRFYNPNKHHYGHFGSESTFGWDRGAGESLPPGWPGQALATDFGPVTAPLWDALLGGPVPDGHVAVDVAAWARDQRGSGQEGGLVSGTVWRLLMRSGGNREPATDAARALAAGAALAIARGGHEGLLVNPHMEHWLIAAGPAGV